MIDRDLDTLDEREFATGDEQFSDKMPRRYQRRRPRNVVPD